MAKLDEKTIRKIELDISRKLIEIGLKPSRLIFDTTNFYTHIGQGENLPQKGVSKDKRYDKNLIRVGLTVSDHNIPFQSITYPANESDVRIFSDLIDDICKRLEEVGIPGKDIVIIFDRGMNSATNIKKVVGRMHVALIAACTNVPGDVPDAGFRVRGVMDECGQKRHQSTSCNRKLV